jgi:hypothetical protein
LKEVLYLEMIERLVPCKALLLAGRLELLEVRNVLDQVILVKLLVGDDIVEGNLGHV